jgi:O-acetyl-ADP-ribose deacetylase (regulator of RNase III)
VARIAAIRGDITKLEVDAIVNAANSALSGGGGVDGAIHRAAGDAELRAACGRLGRCAPGDAVATPGFGLPAQWIIHAVGPVWQGGRNDEERTLASCYRRSLEVADDLGVRSIAFPAISTGIFRFPKELAAEVAIRTLSTQACQVERVILVAFDQKTFEIYTSVLAEPSPG